MVERLVVVGGDAAGMAAASQARRRRCDLDIVALEKGPWTSYSACGIPYVVGGQVGGIEDLVVRAPQEFRERFNIDVRTRHEAMAVDLDARRVEVRSHDAGRTYSLGFDHLHLATGGVPARPDVPGIDRPYVHGVQTLQDGADLLRHARDRDVRRVVVVGGGYVGLEMAEAFVERGCQVIVVDAAPQPMGTLDPDMGALVARAMRAHGIDVRTDEQVLEIGRDGVVTAVGHVAADLVVLGTGVAPNSALGREAGLATGARGAIRVDVCQRASAPGVWAAGDCCESFHLVSRRPVHVALGTVANRQGRVAGINLGGGYATFPGVVGTATTKLCSVEISRTGLNQREASEAGLAYEAVRVESTTRAGYFPGAAAITVKMLAERGSGRVLGAQIVGGQGAAKRIDVVAAALSAGMTVVDITGLDLAYAPPFSPVWDPVQVAARKAAEAVGLS